MGYRKNRDNPRLPGKPIRGKVLGTAWRIVRIRQRFAGLPVFAVLPALGLSVFKLAPIASDDA